MAFSLVKFIDLTPTRKESVHGERKGGRDNVVFLDPPGVGKTHLEIALGG